jgi:hypothetical protein
MPSERVRRAVAYIEGGSSDLEPLQAMGLSAKDLDEVLALATWGERTPAHLREAVEHLYESRAREEERAGLGIPVVVVKPEGRSRAKAIAVGLAALLALGAVIAAGVFIGSRAGRPEAGATRGAPSR